MKKKYFFLINLISSICFSQNSITNGNFETTGIGSMNPPWLGYSNQILVDNLTNSQCGNNNNGDSSIFQVFNATPNLSYNVAFDYRWVTGNGNYNMTVRIKTGETGGRDLQTFVLNNTPDIWHNASFSFVMPIDEHLARIIFYKSTGNRPLRIDNVLITPQNISQAHLVDPQTPINAQPYGISGDWNLEFSDEFNNSSINNSKWVVSVSNSSRSARPNLGVDDWWWTSENAFLNGEGDLVLRSAKIDNNTMYCGSVESRGNYEPTFGFLEAKIKIANTSKGNHTAFWLQGSNQGNIDNSGADGAEIDIFESAWITNDTKAVVHFDGYGTQKKNHTIPYNTPNLHNGYHIFGLHWTEHFLDIYYDGIKVTSTNANKPFPFTIDPNGYPLVPQVPEWLWLSVGASFADGDFQSQPIGILSDALVDYVRVYKPNTTLGIESTSPKKSFSLFPNPVENIIKIKTKENNYTLEIFDLSGKLLMSSNQFKTATINMIRFAKGIYLFKLSSMQVVEIYKIIK